MSWPPPNINKICEQLPNELIDHIVDYATTTFEPKRTVSMRPVASMDPSIPPADGSCPFLGLPCELRRAIFGYVLPLKKMKDKIVEPYQKSAKSEATPDDPQVAPVVPAAPVAPIAPALHTGFVYRPPWHSARLSRGNAASTKSKTPVKEVFLAVGDALVLCKSIAADILVTLYEERTFALNVYEGIQDGGIEFLNSGRQRLQYREHFTFVRFKRFEGPEDPFGFARIKKLLIRVYPATEAGKEHKSSRHDAMHTHFMMRALVELLKQKGKFGLNRLQIRFVEPSNTQWRPHPWQNTSNFSPRSSSIHGITVIELILRGLLELRQVQTAICELPPGLYRDGALTDFVDRFQGVITCKLHSSIIDDEITLKVDGARDMLDNWIHFTMFSTKASRSMNSTLADSDFFDVNNADSFDYYPDQDGFFEPPVCTNEIAETAVIARLPPILRDVYEKRVTTTQIDADSTQHTKRRSPESKISSSDRGKNGATRTYSTRRSARMYPLSSSGRVSSGRASPLELIIIDDDDDTPNMVSLLDDDESSYSRRNVRALTNARQRLGANAISVSRRLDRERARAAFDI
ncbi:hypothetical protein E4T44_01465 [Aureobasidium sp. EXF-8845]|nr:hypothetical protein E4T44_01465 [Aureobasidium sp. EXF-8845]KAI4857112.1 hypothetical protein E4T45_01403 [Aureobasidium sp. EXF-8846]